MKEVMIFYGLQLKVQTGSSYSLHEASAMHFCNLFYFQNLHRRCLAKRVGGTAGSAMFSEIVRSVLLFKMQ